MKSLNDPARRATRKGLKECVVRQVDFDLVAQQALFINRSALARQGRQGLPFYTDVKRWKSYIQAIRSFPDIEPYGAFVGDHLCAYVLAVLVDDTIYLVHPFCETESLEHRPMNALIFTLLREVMPRPEVNRVSYGLEPFAELPELERFKTSMGFVKRPIGRRVLVNPFFRLFLTRPAVSLARVLAARNKFRGLMEDYLTFAEAFQAGRLRPGLQKT